MPNHCVKDVAIIDGTTEETRNYQELSRDRDGLAAALQSMNFAADEVVGILSPNHCDYYAGVTGPLRAGLTVTPMNPVYTEEEITTQLVGSNSRVVFAHPDGLEKVEAAAKAAPCVKDIIVFGDQNIGGRTSVRSLINATSTKPSPITISNDTTALLPYSSGTTGAPACLRLKCIERWRSGVQVLKLDSVSLPMVLFVCVCP